MWDVAGSAMVICKGHRDAGLLHLCNPGESYGRFHAIEAWPVASWITLPLRSVIRPLGLITGLTYLAPNRPLKQ